MDSRAQLETHGFQGSAKATFKPRDVEEPVDFWINRRLAGVLVAVFAPLPITPNQVTLLSGVAGLAAGLVIGTSPLSHSWHVPIGGALLYLSVLLDCADGQLARLRGETSMVGRMLDGCIDVVPTAAAFVGFAAYLYRSGYPFWPLIAVGFAAGYSMKWHVHAYDHAKNLYLRNSLPSSAHANPLPSIEEILSERDRLARQGDWVGALILRGFAGFTQSQRRGWQERRIGLGVEGTRTPAERAVYRAEFGRTMRLWTWNGLGTHLCLLLAAACLTPVYAAAALVAWGFILLPMNVATWALMRNERQIERTVQAILRKGGPWQPWPSPLASQPLPPPPSAASLRSRSSAPL